MEIDKLSVILPAADKSAKFIFNHFSYLKNGMFISISAHDLNADWQMIFIEADRNGQRRDPPNIRISNVWHIFGIRFFDGENFFIHIAMLWRTAVINRKDEQSLFQIAV